MGRRCNESSSIDSRTTLTSTAQTWPSRLAPYRQPDDRRAVIEIAITVIPFIAMWIIMWMLHEVHPLLALLLAIPAAGLLLRLFMIQHDCGHNALFASRKVNDWVGRVLGVLTLTPYDFWRHSHALHHAASGNLDRRGIGDIDTLTVDEYRALGRFGRLRYRIYRHPVVMFGIGPVLLFIFFQRVPLGAMRSGAMPWVSTVLTNLGIAVFAGLMIYAVGLGAFLMVHIPVVMIGASAGVWLFYVQHQFEGTYWEHTPPWTHLDAALHGSSYYDLPKPLMWLTGNIGIHHLHHLSSRIPFHRLPDVLRDYPELRQVGHLTLRESLKCVKLTLWDEKAKRLVSFREAAAA